MHGVDTETSKLCAETIVPLTLIACTICFNNNNKTICFNNNNNNLLKQLCTPRGLINTHQHGDKLNEYDTPLG